MTADTHFISVHEPGTPGAATLLLLHGTGGNDHSRPGLGRQVAPGWNLLAVRGRSLEEGWPRFFRRFSATSYDQDQLASEADALAAFVGTAAREHGFAADAVWALGYSNGANIGVAALARNPGNLRGAVLLRGVLPFDEPPQADLTGRAVLVLNGESDPYAGAAAGLAPWLRQTGAEVQEHSLPAGHELTAEDARLSADWLSRQAG